MNRLRLLSTAVVLAAPVLGPLVDQFSEEPESWAVVSIESLKRQYARRTTSPTAFARVRLDINGDGLKDESALVVDRIRHCSGLRVCPVTKDEGVTPDCCILVEYGQEDAYDIMGLDLRPPGWHDYNALNDRAGVDGRVSSRSRRLTTSGSPAVRRSFSTIRKQIASIAIGPPIARRLRSRVAVRRRRGRSHGGPAALTSSSCFEGWRNSERAPTGFM